ncbi:hypothetical protein HDU81_010856 [Chytriomyces hyalinus]|nr:hypothetical protein HDU81_010856 [Chytriomyces hyalinus]
MSSTKHLINSHSAPASGSASPRVPRRALTNLGKRISAPFFGGGGESPRGFNFNASAPRLPQQSVASKVADDQNFFFAPQVANPSEDIDAVTVIGGRAAKVPHMYERWILLKEQTKVNTPAEGFDVDEMLGIGVALFPQRTRGFDVDAMLSAADDLAGMTEPFNDIKRRSSFPPPGYKATALTALTMNHSLRKKNEELRTKSRMSLHRLAIRRGESEELFPQEFLLPSDTTKDIDDMLLSAPAEDLMKTIDSAKTREKVKEVLQDVEDYISNASKKQNAQSNAFVKVDVDQLVEISTPQPTDDLKAKTNSIFPMKGRSRKGSLFAAFAPNPQVSQSNLTQRPKITSGATTAIVDEINAVYYPWTAEGANANDVNDLFDFGDKVHMERNFVSTMPVKSIPRQDIDTVVLAGSRDDISEHAFGGSRAAVQQSVFYRAVNPRMLEDEVLAEETSGLMKTTSKSLHQSAPQIHKVEFILPERSHEAFHPSKSNASLSGGNVIKRDIDFLFDMANKEPLVKVVTDVTDRAEQRDFNELLDMADSILNMNDQAARSRDPHRHSISFINIRASMTNRASVTGRPSVGRRISVAPRGSMKNNTISRPGSGGGSLRDIVDNSIFKAFSESSIAGLNGVVKFEMSKHAALVKDVGVKLTDFDGLMDYGT